MDLKTFVKETLTQIAEGVNEASQAVKDAKCSLVRGEQRYIGEKSQIVSVTHNSDPVPVSIVNFNVVLSEIVSDGKNSGIGVLFAPLEMGIKKGTNQQSSSQTSVSFQVYLSL